MTTGWLIVNIVLVAVVAALVALPAVLIPHKLHRNAQKAAEEHASSRRWVTEGRQRDAA